MSDKEKQILREKIWKLMEDKKVACFPLPIKGRIPNFIGSERAAILLTTLPEWKMAKVVFANPDYAQKPVRELALKQNKILIMASPKLKEGFIKIEPRHIKGKEIEASTIRGSFKYGIKIQEIIKPDLIITGCVAVDKNGWRLGKGGGYGDREIKMNFEKFGNIPVATTVHELQIVDEVPHNENDTKVNFIITPERVIRVS